MIYSTAPSKPPSKLRIAVKAGANTWPHVPTDVRISYAAIVSIGFEPSGHAWVPGKEDGSSFLPKVEDS